MWESEDQGVYCEIVSPSNIRRCTHKVSLIRLPKCQLNKDGINRQAKWKGGAQEASTLQKDEEAPRKSVSGRDALPQGRAHQMAIS